MKNVPVMVEIIHLILLYFLFTGVPGHPKTLSERAV